MTKPKDDDKAKTALEISITPVRSPFMHNSTAGMPGEEKLWEEAGRKQRKTTVSPATPPPTCAAKS